MLMNLSLILFLLFAAFLLPFLWIHKLSQRSKQRVPPGRSGWPFIGETLDYFFRLRCGDLEKFVTERRNKHSSDIFRTSLLGHSMAVFCTADGNKFIFSNENKYFRHWWPSTVDKLFPKSNNKPNTEHTKLLRRLLTVILKRDVLREYVGDMHAVMEELLQTDSEVKIGDVAKRYTFKLACIAFLGTDDPCRIDELERAIEVIGAGLHSVPLNLPGTALHRAIKTSKLMRKLFEEMIRQRRLNLSDHSSSSGKDFIAHLLRATDDDGQLITEADMACILVGLLQGSYSTVHSTITNTMMYLSENPDVYNLVLGDDLGKMKYSWHVVCEVLRLKPPTQGAFKEAVKDVNYGGYTIPKGWKIHWITYATHKNPEYFPNPDKFDPSRFEGDGPASYTFLPFGAGAHMCPGNEYARLVILVFLHNMITRFGWERLIPDEQVLHYPFPRPAHGLPVKLYSRHP